MQSNNLNSIRKKSKRVGRGGKRGTYSGRGSKGQTARAGRRIRPAIRDLLIRTPKLRGYKNKPIKRKLPVINVGDLEKMVPGNIVNKESLSGAYKILGNGEVKRALTVQGLPVSKSAKAKIEKAGGKVTVK